MGGWKWDGDVIFSRPRADTQSILTSTPHRCPQMDSTFQFPHCNVLTFQLNVTISHSDLRASSFPQHYSLFSFREILLPCHFFSALFVCPPLSFIGNFYFWSFVPKIFNFVGTKQNLCVRVFVPLSKKCQENLQNSEWLKRFAHQCAYKNCFQCAITIKTKKMHLFRSVRVLMEASLRDLSFTFGIFEEPLKLFRKMPRIMQNDVLRKPR